MMNDRITKILVFAVSCMCAGSLFTSRAINMWIAETSFASMDPAVIMVGFFAIAGLVAWGIDQLFLELGIFSYSFGVIAGLSIALLLPGTIGDPAWRGVAMVYAASCALFFCLSFLVCGLYKRNFEPVR